MAGYLSVVTLLAVSLGPATFSQECTEPGPGRCRTGSPSSVSAVHYSDIAALNCSFERNLCCFKQGCADDGMGNWSTEQGSATVKQNRAGKCAFNSYSVLESPWVKVSRPSCIELISSSFESPYKLEVFITTRDDAQSYEQHYEVAHYYDTNIRRFELSISLGKIQFRVRGGGAGRLKKQPKLFYVQVTESRCEVQAQATSTTAGHEVHDPSTCTIAKRTTPPTEHSTSSTATRLTTRFQSSPKTVSITSQQAVTAGNSAVSTSKPAQLSSPDAGSVSTTPYPSVKGGMSSDEGDGANVAVIAGASVAAVVVVASVVFFVVFVCKRKSHARPGSDAGEMPGRGQYENQGFHFQPGQHSADDRSTPVPRESPDSENHYLQPTNVYDGFTNRNSEQNPYDALANQSNAYEGLSPNRTQNRVYDSLAAKGRQNEDY